MARSKVQFVCQNCGTVHSRWAGKCDGCGEWNTIVEDDPSGGIGSGPGKPRTRGKPVALTSLSGDIEDAPRIETGIAELDRVTGGGFVRGSALLVGGDPGIGKSTLLMQAAAALARRSHSVVYVSGEEAVAQIRLRAQRLGAADTDVKLAAETNVEDILATVSQGNRPDLVIIDSIQTLWSDMAESAPGTVTQVRMGAQAMIRFAKKTGAAVVLVGHVTKEGQIAGPRVVEHMVDAVLYFEGDRGHHYRILRTVKNRFGPTDEIGVFEMSDRGLGEVANPSELFLGERNDKAPGASVFAGMEGTRPVLVEVQALVAPSPLGTPRRAVVGWDSARLSMVLAVLEAHCGVRLSPARCLSKCCRRLPNFRARGRPCGGFCTGFITCRACSSGRLRLFRRNQPVWRCSTCGSYSSASERGRKTGIRARCPAQGLGGPAEKRQGKLEFGRSPGRPCCWNSWLKSAV